jgi:hypothetical protein
MKKILNWLMNLFSAHFVLTCSPSAADSAAWIEARPAAAAAAVVDHCWN